MKRVTRREAQCWLQPYRKAVEFHRNGIDHMVDGVRHMQINDEWFNMAHSFVGLAVVVERMMPGIDLYPFDKFISAVTSGDDEPTGVMEAKLNEIEDRMIRLSKAEVHSASVTEEIAARLAQEYDAPPDKD
jgi:hexokinase